MRRLHICMVIRLKNHRFHTVGWVTGRTSSPQKSLYHLSPKVLIQNKCRKKTDWDWLTQIHQMNGCWNGWLHGWILKEFFKPHPRVLWNVWCYVVNFGVFQVDFFVACDTVVAWMRSAVWQFGDQPAAVDTSTNAIIVSDRHKETVEACDRWPETFWATTHRGRFDVEWLEDPCDGHPTVTGVCYQSTKSGCCRTYHQGSLAYCQTQEHSLLYSTRDVIKV